MTFGSFTLWTYLTGDDCLHFHPHYNVFSLLLFQGPRMVRDVFRLAKENAPAIIFIDEVDAIATARFDAQTGADREVQRILMELLNQVCVMKIFT